MTFFATKSITTLRAEADAAGERALRRSLNAVQLTTLGIGAVIGAGVFVFTGVAAARYAGPAVPLSFVAAGIACTFAALCYAEMASAVPVAGSAYTYSYATMGEFIAWIIGWDLVLEYAMGASTVGAGWSSYFVALLKDIGVDAVSTAAQEAKHPQKDMPVGIIGSLLICTLLYIVVSAILTGLMPYATLDVAHPVGFAVDSIPGLRWMGWIVNLGAVLGLASVVLVMLLGQSRVFYSMSRDGLLPPWVGAVHPRFRTPWLTQILVGVFAAVFAGFFPIDLLVQLVNIGTLLAFVLV